MNEANSWKESRGLFIPVLQTQARFVFTQPFCGGLGDTQRNREWTRTVQEVSEVLGVVPTEISLKS